MRTQRGFLFKMVVMAKAFAIVLLMVVTIESTDGIRDKAMPANVTQTLDFLLASNRYDKRLRPGFGGPPITISVNFFIKSMGPVSDNDQSFGLDCYFRQHWYDLRLRYQKFPGLEEFSMSWLFLDRVWKPDTYFVNGKRSFLHRITVPNKFLRLRHDGYITYSMRLTITASCPMYLRKFPLDTQRCPLVLGSYGYTNKDVIYKWTDKTPIGLQEGVEIAQFDLANITVEDEKLLTRGGLKYSSVQANFWLKRHTGYFMLQVYIPCGLIVVCSWISFWIDPDAVPARVYVPCGLIVLSSWVSFWIDPEDVAARVALGVTTVLSLTTMGFGGRAQLPKVSYWTALDWFVIICFTSVFSVMIEYAIVNFIDKFKKDLKKILQKKQAEEKVIVDVKEKSALSKQKERSASFSFFPSKSPKQEQKIQTIVQLEIKPSRSPSPTPKKYQKTLKKHRSKSISNIPVDTTEQEVKKTELPELIVTASEDLIDLEREVMPIEVILDVEESLQGDTQRSVRRKLFKNFFKNVKPQNLLEKIKILPGDSDILNLLDSPDPPDKFSKIDVQSRKNFPIVFLLSLFVYLFAFSYYLTDDIPIRDTGIIDYKNKVNM